MGLCSWPGTIQQTIPSVNKPAPLKRAMLKSTRDSSFCPSRSSAVTEGKISNAKPVLISITAVEICKALTFCSLISYPIGSIEKLPISYVI